MTTLREAAQQALEALEQIAVLAEYGTTGPGKCGSRPLSEKQATALRLAVSDLSRAQITTLRAALAEQEQESPEEQLFDYEEWDRQKREEFADLLIQECIITVKKRYMGDNNREDIEVLRCVSELKNRFGVE